MRTKKRGILLSFRTNKSAFSFQLAVGTGIMLKMLRPICGVHDEKLFFLQSYKIILNFQIFVNVDSSSLDCQFL